MKTQTKSKRERNLRKKTAQKNKCKKSYIFPISGTTYVNKTPGHDLT